MKDLFTAQKIESGITRIYLPGNVCAYYLEGTKQGLLIDNGFGYGDLRSFVEGISSKPYEVALTHGHLDHAGGSGQWDHVWISQRDIPVARNGMNSTYRKYFLDVRHGYTVTDSDLVPVLPEESFLALEDRQIFDLGELHAQFIAVPGHTGGSMVVYIPEQQTCIFGDDINSLCFMQLMDSVPFTEYRDSLIRFDHDFRGAYDRVLFSHPHNVGSTELVPEMIDVCTYAIEHPGCGMDVSRYFGKGVKIAMDVSLDHADKAHFFHRLDGKSANFIYRYTEIE